MSAPVSSAWREVMSEAAEKAWFKYRDSSEYSPGEWMRVRADFLAGYTAAAVPQIDRDVLTVDDLAQIIRFVDGNNNLGAGELAEKIVGLISLFPKPVEGEVEWGVKRPNGFVSEIPGILAGQRYDEQVRPETLREVRLAQVIRACGYFRVINDDPSSRTEKGEQ